jgi:hypothetical protein
MLQAVYAYAIIGLCCAALGGVGVEPAGYAQSVLNAEST